jgi:hypothetical protein
MKLYLQMIRAVLKDSDGFLAYQTITPIGHGQNVSILAGSDISRIYIHTVTASKDSQSDTNQPNDSKSETSSSVDASKFQIERSSLISSVRGSVALEFGAWSFPTLIAELLLSSSIDAEVPESCLVKGNRNLHLSNDVHKKLSGLGRREISERRFY